jgi:Trk K+ transport system NAD-binding subunit
VILPGPDVVLQAHDEMVFIAGSADENDIREALGNDTSR